MLELIRNIPARRDEDGASAVEYGLLVVGIAAVIALIVFSLGTVVHNAFSTTCSKVAAGATPATTCSG
jgi:pilus assembly protein Flp/PilA